MQLAGNAGPKKSPKIRHLRMIAQLCPTMSKRALVAKIIRKKLLNSNVSHTFSQHGELRPTSGWDLLASLGHPSTFQLVSPLGSVNARHSSSGRQPNFAALNRGRHLYSAGRPSRWALAHILVCDGFCCGSVTVDVVDVSITSFLVWSVTPNI